MSLKRLTMAGLIAISLTTAACGGGGGSAPAIPGSGPTNAPTNTPTSTPTTAPTAGANTQSFGVSGAPAISSGTLNLTSASAIQVAFSSTTPTGTALAKTRKPKSISSTGGSSLAYITVSSDEDATVTQIGGQFTLVSAVPNGQSAFLAVWDGSNWDNVGTTPGTVSGTSVTFPLTNLTAAVATTAYFAIFYNTSALAAQTPTPVPTVSPTSGATAAPSGTFVDSACTQSPAAATSTLTVASTFFSAIIPNAHTICISAWDLSNDIDTALESAAHNGASVTVITPYSENSSNSSDIAAIVAAGGHAKYEYTSSHGTAGASIAYQQAPMDIHAKFALVDGVAYMDGHNWFTTDVVTRDGYAADFAAIQSDLVSFPTPPPSGSGTALTTDKQVSLNGESTFLQTVAIPDLNTGAADEYDFITESFNPNPAAGDYNDDVYDGMCQISQLGSHPTMHLVLESESGYSSAAKTALQNLGLSDPNAVIRSNNNGHEKISMIRKNNVPVAAWYGSSNSTTTDLFDWGITTTDPAVLSALANYFDTVEFANATAITPGSGTPPACGTVHS